MTIYDPSVTPAYELPITRRARELDRSGRLWCIWDAQSFCRALLDLPAGFFDFTAAEWQAVSAVAAGGPWPVPEHPYTREDWRRDRQFSAARGQEITEEIYDEMLDVLPPLRLPRCQRTENISAGFLVSEAACSALDGRQLYSAFGKNAAGKYYYLGLLPARPGEAE